MKILKVPLERVAEFRIDPEVKTFFIRVNCESCFKWECVSCYEEDVKKRDFNLTFFECEKCGRIVCGICLKDRQGKEDVECPFCGHKGLEKITPSSIYVCNICVKKSKHEKLCGKKECKYPHIKK